MRWSDDLPVDGQELPTFGKLDAEREAERQGSAADDAAAAVGVFFAFSIIGAALAVWVLV